MAQLVKQIWIKTDNKPGTLAKVTAPIKDAGVAILAACAWGEGEKANFMILTENNGRALESVKKAGFSGEESEAVSLTLPHKVGALDEAAQKLGKAGIDIQFVYVTAAGPNALCVLATNNNKKAAEVLG